MDEDSGGERREKTSICDMKYQTSSGAEVIVVGFVLNVECQQTFTILFVGRAHSEQGNHEKAFDTKHTTAP